jgi:hypothetical protein
MLLCNNYIGGYHLFCLKLKLTQVPVDIWYYSSCFPTAPWFLLRPCHVFPDLGLGIDTWEFHLSLLLCIVYIYACISSWFISFYLWLVLIFLFNRVYYGFTLVWHRTSQHYTSRQFIRFHRFWNLNNIKKILCILMFLIIAFRKSFKNVMLIPFLEPFR